jgi:hypothetical protein
MKRLSDLFDVNSWLTVVESHMKTDYRMTKDVIIRQVYVSLSIIARLIFSTAQQPLMSQDLLIIEVSRSHTFKHTALGRTPLDEWSARRRDLYLTTHNTHKRQTFMPPAGFEPTIPASERPQTNALDRAAASDYVASNIRMVSEKRLTRSWQYAVVVWLLCYPWICLKGTDENREM